MAFAVFLLVAAVVNTARDLEYGALCHLSRLAPKDVDPQRPQRIPKIIFRASDSARLAPRAQRAWDFTSKHNPEYEQVHVDARKAEQFLRTNFPPAVAQAHAAASSAGRHAILRYCLLDTHGGVFLSENARAGPLRRLFRPSDAFVVSPSARSGGCAQWTLASAPHNPLFAHAVAALTDSPRDLDGQFAASASAVLATSDFQPRVTAPDGHGVFSA